MASSIFSTQNIILCNNLQNTNSQIFPTKTPHGNPLTDYQQKKRKEKKKKSKHFFNHLLGITIIYNNYNSL